MRRAIAAVFLGVLLSAGLAGQAEPAQKVRLTMPVTALSMTPVYVAKTKGYFAEEGLDVETTTTGGGGPDIIALIAGEADFSFTSGDNVILATQEGKRLLIVMVGLHRLFINWAMHKDVAVAKGITESTPLPEKLKALKGLNVGVTQLGALTSHLASFVIRRAGYVPQEDVRIVPIGAGPSWVAALENRKVDVALTATPVPETAISRGFAMMFINNARGEDPSVPEFLMQVVVTRPEVTQKNPELVRRMVRALMKANAWALASTPEQVVEVLHPHLGKTDPALLLAGVRSTLPTLSPDGQPSERSVQITQDILQQAGILKRRLAYAEFITTDFLPK